MPEVSEIRMARNCEESETIFNYEKPDIMLLDIHLPGMNGIELLRYINTAGRFCCVLMIINRADE
jgi:two-component system response regulator AdeR